MGNYFGKPPLSASDILLGRANQTNSLADLLTTPSPAPLNMLGLLGEAYRRREEWNARFAYWERPASVTEEGTIDRAERNVRRAILDNSWLCDQDVSIHPQGSYHNNTNVRVEADIDLRIVHPAVKVEYNKNVLPPTDHSVFGYTNSGLSEIQIFSRMRMELISDLSQRFGGLNVVAGRKAIRIKGITGSRAEVDVVPAVSYHHIYWVDALNRYETAEGIAIYSTDGRWTLNFPEQHQANGVAKGDRTARRFKKNVRIFKRLRADMTERGLLAIAIPSFLVECLVYIVEDDYFLVDSDDRYDRVLRIARRMRELLAALASTTSMTEINDIKLLFHENQPWRLEHATAFVNAALAHLGDG